MKAKLGYASVALVSILAVLIAYQLADSYIDRLPDHRGFHLVAVENRVSVQPLKKPRRTVLVVVDGLGANHFATTESARRMEDVGQCRYTDAGSITISRPVYTVISTGLEQDRTGSRNNDDTSPVAVESIWQVARDAGLRVHAASNLPWWRQLFPGAFSSYRFDLDETQNLFVLDEIADLSLIHPVRVDTAGHKFGAASSEYEESAKLVDTELVALIDTLDLEQDLLIVTADHGHSDSGGHGGAAFEIATVLTCYAGPTISSSHDERQRDFMSDSRLIAPTISILLGLPFPRHMRASDDKLDQIWSLVRGDLLGEAYVKERKATIEDFRAKNEARVGKLLGKERAGWNQLYKQGARRQMLWWFAVTLLMGLMIAGAGRLRKQTPGQALLSMLWMACAVAAICLLYIWVRGSFDFTSINKRQEFLNASLGVSLSVGTLFALVHFAIWRNLRRLCLDQASMVVLLLVLSLAHPLIYGVTLGFPLPGPIAIFLPFILGALVISGGMLSCLMALVMLRPSHS